MKSVYCFIVCSILAGCSSPVPVETHISAPRTLSVGDEMPLEVSVHLLAQEASEACEANQTTNHIVLRSGVEIECF